MPLKRFKKSCERREVSLLTVVRSLIDYIILVAETWIDLDCRVNIAHCLDNVFVHEEEILLVAIGDIEVTAIGGVCDVEEMLIALATILFHLLDNHIGTTKEFLAVLIG